ncbi:uncharacterized protein RSE6_12176 [Rhynchosporium secalis]|uniref:Uncharacterized protein n=1 Tax=Rhynchosporium secalis TaxID=38038 RepID=A0A1E1MPQ5_RHYSE|nr:uncharacterized protein RSE6_12176 [Rhynchosporium secalis]
MPYSMCNHYLPVITADQDRNISSKCPKTAEDLCLPSCELFPPQPIFEYCSRPNPLPRFLNNALLGIQKRKPKDGNWVPKILTAACVAEQTSPQKSSRPASEWYPPPPPNPTSLLGDYLSITSMEPLLPALNSEAHPNHRFSSFARPTRLTPLIGLEANNGSEDGEEGPCEEDFEKSSREKIQAAKLQGEIDTYGKGQDWDEKEEEARNHWDALDDGRPFYGKPWGNLQEGQA